MSYRGRPPRVEPLPSHSKWPVALVRRDEPVGSMRRALDLAGGLKELRPGDLVVLKPNVPCAGPPAQAPAGVCTTAEVLEDLIILLKKFGASDIAVAEVQPTFPSSVRQPMRLYAGQGWIRCCCATTFLS